MDIIHLIREISLGNPFLLIFIVSLVSNVIPFASVPYLLVLIHLLRIYRGVESMLLLVLASALGASVGKIAVYGLGRLMARTVSESTRENIAYLSSRLGKWGFLAVFIAAATPVPDDLVNIPIAFTGYSLVEYFIAVLTGKFILKLATVFLGLSIVEAFESVGLGYVGSMIVLGLLSILLVYIVARINWRRVLEHYDKRDLRGAARVLVEDVVNSLNIISIVRSKRDPER
ncbi:MAG: VTT domain-containing protein [Sulfolobales archaeon]